MASFGNVHVVVLGVVDSEGSLIRQTQAVFESEEHGARWARAEERMATLNNLANEWVTATADGDFSHVDTLVEDAWQTLESQTAFLRAKRKLLTAVDRAENTASLERARKLLLGDADYQEEDDA